MQNAQHKLLTDLDETGFGIKYESHVSAFTPLHWHKAIELLLFVNGTVTCKFNNMSFQGTPGDLLLINSYEVHETRCSRDAVYLCVHISTDQMCKYVPNFDQLSFSLTFDPADEAKAIAYEQLRIHMQEILRLTVENPQASKLECHARLFAAAAILVNDFSQTPAVEETKLRRSDMTRLEPVLEYIQLHHGEDLPLDAAADAMGLNKEYFCRLFKKNMGVSYLQYVYQVRTTAVCRELESSDDPIGEIAERHGFRDPKMLNQYFKEVYGCTPSEKRKFFREITLEEPEQQ